MSRRLPGLVLIAVLALSLPGAASAGSDVTAPAKRGNIEPPTTGKIDRAVLMCDFPDSPPPEFDKAHFDGLFSNLHDYFDEASHGKANVVPTVYDWRDIGSRASYGVVPGDGVATDLDGMAQDCVNAQDSPDTRIDFNAFDGIDVVLGEMDPGGFGRAGVGGVSCITADEPFGCWPATWVPAHEAGVGDFGDSRNGMALWAHEIGHSLGLAHAFGYYWDPMGTPCQGNTIAGYGDPIYGCIPVSYLEAQKSDYAFKLHGFGTQHYGLNWVPKAREANVGPGKHDTVSLERVTKPGNSGDLLARAPVKGSKLDTWYTAEARIGVDSSVFDNPDNLPGNGVIVTRVTPTCEVGKPPCKFDYDPVQVMGKDIYAFPDKAMLTPGEKFEKQGVTIKVLSKIGDHGYKIKVINDS